MTAVISGVRVEANEVRQVSVRSGALQKIWPIVRFDVKGPQIRYEAFPSPAQRWAKTACA